MSFIDLSDLFRQIKILAEKSGWSAGNLAVVGCRVSGGKPYMSYFVQEQRWHIDNQETMDIVAFLRRPEHRLLLIPDLLDSGNELPPNPTLAHEYWVDSAILVILPCLKKLLCNEELKNILFAEPHRLLIGSAETDKLRLSSNAGTEMVAYFKRLPT